jgi:hypothetical protein
MNEAFLLQPVIVVFPPAPAWVHKLHRRRPQDAEKGPKIFAYATSTMT